MPAGMGCGGDGYAFMKKPVRDLRVSMPAGMGCGGDLHGEHHPRRPCRHRFYARWNGLWWRHGLAFPGHRAARQRTDRLLRFYARWNGLWWRRLESIDFGDIVTHVVKFLCPLEWAVVETSFTKGGAPVRSVKFLCPLEWAVVETRSDPIPRITRRVS